MIELKLYVDEIDYAALMKVLASNVNIPGGAAAMATRALPARAKDEMAVKYINGNAAKLEQMLENAATNNGIHLKITGAQASYMPGSH